MKVNYSSDITDYSETNAIAVSSTLFKIKALSNLKHYNLSISSTLHLVNGGNQSNKESCEHLT